LPKGGLELPCTYAFIGVDKRLLQKARKPLDEEGKQVDNDVRVEDELATESKACKWKPLGVRCNHS